MSDPKSRDKHRVLLLIVSRGQGRAIIQGPTVGLGVQADGGHVQTKDDISVQFQEGDVVIVIPCQ